MGNNLDVVRPKASDGQIDAVAFVVQPDEIIGRIAIPTVVTRTTLQQVEKPVEAD